MAAACSLSLDLWVRPVRYALTCFDATMDILRLIDRYFDSWNSHHPTSLLQVVGQRGVLHGPLAVEGLSGDSLAEYACALWTAFPDFFLQAEQPSIRKHGARVKWIWRGTHDGEFFGHAATGKCLSLEGVEMIDCSSPDALAVRSCYDALELWRQLGLPRKPTLHRSNG